MKIKILFTNDTQHNFNKYQNWFSLKECESPQIAWESIVEYVKKEGQNKFLFLPEKFLTLEQQRKLVGFLADIEPSKNITLFSLSPSISHGNTQLLVDANEYTAKELLYIYESTINRMGYSKIFRQEIGGFKIIIISFGFTPTQSRGKNLVIVFNDSTILAYRLPNTEKYPTKSIIGVDDFLENITKNGKNENFKDYITDINSKGIQSLLMEIKEKGYTHSK